MTEVGGGWRHRAAASRRLAMLPRARFIVESLLPPRRLLLHRPLSVLEGVSLSLFFF